jgi:hypothetical protein
MWVYLDDQCVAINLQDAYGFFPKSEGDGQWALTVKYKDLDGKTMEHSFSCGKADSVRKAARILLAQLKEVSGAKVTQELEDAIAKAGE